MVWRYSGVQHGPVWLDEYDVDIYASETHCDECGEEFDLDDGGGVEEDEAFCEPCYNKIFGG